MCDTGTPVSRRLICGCYRVRTLLALAALGGVSLGVYLLHPSEVLLTVVAAVAITVSVALAVAWVWAVVLVALSVRRGDGERLRTRPAAARVTLESPPEEWWAAARARGGDGARL